MRLSPRYFATENLDPRLRAGLVGCWLGGGSGLTWFDRSGCGNHGTLTNGPTWTLGEGGKRNAVQFDGTDDHIAMGNVLSFERTDAWTIAAWVKPTLAANGFVVAKQLNTDTYRGYSFLIDTSGNLYSEIISTVLANWIVVTGNSQPIVANRWNHVAMTYNGNSAASGITFYANGNSAAFTINSNALSGTIVTSEGLRIGSRAGNEAPFPGSIEVVRIYSRALSGAEIALLARPDYSPIIQPRQGFRR